MTCATMGCKRERLEGSRHCPSCTLEAEKYYGRFGFAPHGREPSELAKRAIAALTSESLRKESA